MDKGSETASGRDLQNEAFKGIVARIDIGVTSLEQNIEKWAAEPTWKSLRGNLRSIYEGMEAIINLNPRLTIEMVRTRKEAKQVSNGKFTKHLVLVSVSDGEDYGQPKLIRDKVPQLFKKDGKTAVTRVADKSEMPILLAAKMREEFMELLAVDKLQVNGVALTEAQKRPKFIEEMADMEEVIEAIISLNQRVSRADIIPTRLGRRR